MAIPVALVACSGNDDTQGAGGSSSTGGGGGSGTGMGGVSNCMASPDQTICGQFPGFPDGLDCPDGVTLESAGCRYAGDWAEGGTGIDAASLSGRSYCCALAR